MPPAVPAAVTIHSLLRKILRRKEVSANRKGLNYVLKANLKMGSVGNIAEVEVLLVGAGFASYAVLNRLVRLFSPGALLTYADFVSLGTRSRSTKRAPAMEASGIGIATPVRE